MQTPLLANRLGRWLAAAALGLLAAPVAQAQLVGPKAIPGTGSTGYPTLAAAIADLNTQGVGAGGVTFNLAAGYAETFASPTAGAITATGTAANPIVFQKAGTGANPKITAGVGTAALDAIISLAGSDYVTFDGLELAESAANTTTAQQMEFGFALFRPSATDGCQNNTIRNCVVTLNKTNTATFAIYGAASTAASSTSVAATATSGANSGNKVNGNIITNSATGIYFTASTSTALANYDQGNEVGVTAANQVYNFGTTATGWGIGGNYQNGFRVLNNVVNNTLNYAGGTTAPVAASTVTSTLRGIYGNSGPSASIDIIGNTITLATGATTSTTNGIENGIGSTAASNTVNITGNTVQISSATITTGTTIGITNTASAATVNVTGNTVSNCTFTASTTGAFTGISNTASAVTANLNNNTVTGCSIGSTATTAIFNGVVNSGAGTTANLNTNTVTNNTTFGTGTMFLVSGGSPSTLNLNGNTVTGNSKTPAAPGSSITMQCLTGASAAVTASNNTVSNNTIVISGTTSSSGTIYGYTNSSSPPSETLTSNTFTGLAVSGTSTSGSHTVIGIRTNTLSTTVQTITLNTIGGLSVSGSGTGTVTGMLFSTGGGTGSNYSRNKIYDLSAVGTGAAVNGVSITGGGTFPLNNNLIGDLRTPVATGLAAVSGIQISGSTAANVYFNTIYLNASSTGATFGTQGIYLNSTSVGLNLFDNIVVNLSTPAGTGGATAAIRRSSGTAGTVPANLFGNNNLYYAGTPSATNLIYTEGTTTQTNAQQTLAAYKAFLLNREANSVTETNTPFASTTGTAANFLHLTPGAPTQAESGGQSISGITTDYDGDTRNASTPDIGADEGSFQLVDVTGPTITITALGGSAGSTVSRTVAVVITDPSGVATGANAPRVYFRKGTTGAFVTAAAPAVSGSTYTFTFDYSQVGGVVAGDAIQYYVAAQDALGNLSTNPTTGGGGVSPPGTTPPTVFYSFTILPTLSGTYYVSATAATSPVPARTYATLTAAVNAYNTSALGGAVTFLLLDPTYSTAETFPVAVLNNPDASAANTLTIKPSNATGTTAFAITGSNATAILQLLASDYVTIDGSLGNTLSATDLRPSRDLTITNTNTGSSSTVVQQFAQFTNDGATFNTIKNLTAVGTATASTIGTLYGVQLQGVSNATTPSQYTNNTVQNVAVRSTQVGIASLGGALALKNQNVVITQNDLNAVGAGALTRNGILLTFDNNGQVTQNTIGNITSTSDASGISLGFTISNFSNSTFTGSEVSNALVSRNTIGSIISNSTFSAVGIGAATSTTGTNTIANNMVAGVIGNGTSGDFSAGIFVNGSVGGGTTRVLYNSVSMTGTNPGTSAATQPNFGLAIGGSSPTLEIRNNVFYNNLTVNGAQSYAIGFAYAGAPGSYAGLTSGNNAFFGTNGIGLTNGLASGTVRTTLADLNAETGQDRPTTATGPAGTSLTLSASPFVSATDLHVLPTSPDGLALNGAATPIADVTVDFDNEARSATTPDIGADEFVTNLDIRVAALTAPVANSTCFGATETVTASLTNASTATLNFATNPVTVTVTITPVTATGTVQTFTTVVNTGTLAAGASQAVTFATTADLSALGTYSATITASLVGDDNTANNVLSPTVTITSGTRSAAFTYPTATICAGQAGTVAATLGTGATAGTFSSTTGLTINATTGAITPSTSTAGTYTVTNTLPATATCPATVITQSVTISPATSATFSYAGSPFCRSSATAVAPSVTGTVGGTFSSTSGLTINATTGAITPSTSTAGTYTVTYSVGGLCPSSSTQSVVITNAPVATFSYGTSSTYCVSGATNPTVTLGTGATAGSFSAAPTGLTLNATTGAITLSSSTPGTYTVTNSIAAANGCAATTATATVTITPAQVATFSYGASSTFCLSSTTNPTVTLGSGATAGTFSSTAGLALNATTGAITLASTTAGTYVVTNTVAAANGCAAATATSTVVITTAPVATFSYPTATTYCAGSASTVTPTLGTGATAGTFSSTTGLSLNATTGVITLATSAAGTYTVTNAIAASGSCAAASATSTVTIAPATSAAFSYSSTSFCVSGATAPVATVTGTSGGTFSSTTGLSLNATTGAITLASSTPGTYTVTYTVAGACGTSSTQTVTITAAPVATFGYGTSSTYCVSGATNPTVTLGTGATAGSFSAAPSGLTLNATTGAITLSSSTPGTYTVTNSIAAANGCAATTATATVTITAAQVATFSYGTTPTYCVSGATNPSVVLGAGAAAGTFSSTTGLTINATTGAITLASSTPGTYTVTNSIAAANGCAATTATTTVTITAAPVATFSYPSTSICAGQTATVSPTLGTGATAGTFSSTTGLSINATTGVISPATSTAGTYTVTNTVAAAGGCAAVTSTQTVTILPLAVASFSYGTSPTFCVSGTTAPTVVLGAGATAGTFSSTTGLSLNATTGAITLASSTPGTYTVTNTVAASGAACGNTATTTVTITAAPLATFSYATAAACEGSTAAITPTLGTGATAGTFSSTTGLTLNATTGAITLSSSTPGTYTVTNTVAAAGGCAATSANTTFVVNPRPTAPVLTASYNGTTTTLSSSAATGNQFYLGGVPVAGATGQTLVLTGLPAQLGAYTVTVTNPTTGCVSLPSNVLVVTGAKNGLAGTSLRLFPNPTPTGQLTLELTGFRLTTQLTVLDALGRVVSSQLLPANAGTAVHPLDLSGLATGVYLLQLRNAEGVLSRRIVRE